MTDMAAKLQVLAKVGKLLNDNHITWAVGASAMLYFKGLVSDFEDFDILVDEKDAELVRTLLLRVGVMGPSKNNGKYKTRYFMEFVIDEMEFDVMAGFTILSEGKEHYFPLKTEHIQEYAEVEGVTIPLHSVDEWRTYYTLMGRVARVQLIDLKYNEKPQRR